MAVLYLLSPGSSVRKDAGRLIIEKEGTIISRMPIFMLTSIVVGMRANITTPALFACMEERVPVFFIDHKGKTVGQIAGEAMTLCMLRHQLACLEDSERRIVLAKHIVMAKLRGQYRLLNMSAMRRIWRNPLGSTGEGHPANRSMRLSGRSRASSEKVFVKMHRRQVEMRMQIVVK